MPANPPTGARAPPGERTGRSLIDRGRPRRAPTKSRPPTLGWPDSGEGAERVHLDAPIAVTRAGSTAMPVTSTNLRTQGSSPGWVTSEAARTSWVWLRKLPSSSHTGDPHASELGGHPGTISAIVEASTVQTRVGPPESGPGGGPVCERREREGLFESRDELGVPGGELSGQPEALRLGAPAIVAAG